eukprot:jgi/Orpsp1_1/1179272/evm.model.c7180000068701.1
MGIFKNGNKSNEEKLFDATFYDQIKNVKSILENADKKNKLLDINRITRYEYYPLLKAIENNNSDIVILLIDYANSHNIVLELNKKNENENYPLINAIENNNIEI